MENNAKIINNVSCFWCKIKWGRSKLFLLSWTLKELQNLLLSWFASNSKIIWYR